MTKFVCFYCHGHVYKAESKGCPQCQRTVPSDRVEQVKKSKTHGRPDNLNELFDNLTYESDKK